MIGEAEPTPTPSDEFGDQTDFAELKQRGWISPHGVLHHLGQGGHQTHMGWANEHQHLITPNPAMRWNFGDDYLKHPFYKALHGGWIRKVTRRQYHVGSEKHADSVRLHVALHHPEVRRIRIDVGNRRSRRLFIDMKKPEVNEAYVGYKLTPLARGRLLKAFPPHYENVVAHHVTTDFLGNRQTAFRPPSGKITVIGHAHDPERGIHAAVVRVGDLTHQGMEPDKLLHITISHRKGARPVHSNDAIKKGWKPVEPFEIEGEPFLGESSWSTPKWDRERGEFARVSKETGLPFEKLRRAFNRGRVAPVSDDHFGSLENTDANSGEHTTVDSVHQMGKAYGGKDSVGIHRALTKGDTLPAPIILHRPGKNPSLVAGNTRLTMATVLGKRPHALHVNVDEARAAALIRQALGEYNPESC